MEGENKKLRDRIAALTAENEQLKKQLPQPGEEQAPFVEFRGVLWKKVLDGEYLLHCPKCRKALAALPAHAPDFLMCRPCDFDAPFHPNQIASTVSLILVD